MVVEDRLEQEAADERQPLLVRVGAGQVGAALGELLKEAVLRLEDLAPEGGVQVRSQPALATPGSPTKVTTVFRQ